MTWVAGIDGGGTSTRLQVRDAQNAVLSSAEFGPFNIASIGEQAFCQRLDELWAACPALADCAALCIGGAGVSSPKARQLLEASLAQRGLAGALMLCSDFEIALRGAMDGPGCILIAGTGSVGFGRNTAGQTARVGGWGHLIDDCGSGYALGRAALALAVQTADGRADAQTLLQAVYQATGSQDVQGILNYVYYSGQDKSAIAALAKAVLACAQAGDEASLAILRQGAAELARIAQALSKRLDMPRPRLALLGGLLTHDSPYRVLAFEALLPYAQIVSAQHDALWGAAQLAYEKSRETK